MTLETVLPIPDIFSARRVLCVQPHYDDNDIAAGGTIARLKGAGAEVVYLTVTDDLMGVVDRSLSSRQAAAALQRDQLAAGALIGVYRQIALGFPDAGDYDYFALRREMLRYLRELKPDLLLAPDPWLTYEAHRDHIQTGLAATEAVIFLDLLKIASSDPDVDAAYAGGALKGVAFYFTREPNLVIDIDSTWEKKLAAVRCYQAQFEPAGMKDLIALIDQKSRQAAQGMPFEHGEPLKALHPAALHCAF